MPWTVLSAQPCTLPRIGANQHHRQASEYQARNKQPLGPAPLVLEAADTQPLHKAERQGHPTFNDRHSHKGRRDVISFFTSNLFACSRAPALQTLGRISLPCSPTNVIPRDGAVGLPGARQNPNRRGESSRAGAGRDSCGQTRADIEGEAGGAVRRAAVLRVQLDNVVGALSSSASSRILS